MIVLEAPTVDIADPLEPFRFGLELLDTGERFGRAKGAIRHIDSEIDQGYQEYNNLRVLTKVSEDHRAILWWIA
jgi:hypothetical protein